MTTGGCRSAEVPSPGPTSISDPRVARTPRRRTVGAGSCAGAAVLATPQRCEQLTGSAVGRLNQGSTVPDHRMRTFTPQPSASDHPESHKRSPCGRGPRRRSCNSPTAEVAAVHEANQASWQISTDQPQPLVIGLFIRDVAGCPPGPRSRTRERRCVGRPVLCFWSLQRTVTRA